MQKAIIELTDMDTSLNLYRCEGVLFDWIVPPSKNSVYWSDTYYTLVWGDDKVKQVTAYQMVDIEPIPSPDECRVRMKALIDKMPDSDVLGEYLQMEQSQKYWSIP